VTTKILFVEFEQGTVDRVLRPIVDEHDNYVAIILGSTDIVEGRGRYLYDTEPSKFTPAPIYEINLKATNQLKSLLGSDSTVNITLTTGDINQWSQLERSPWSYLLQIVAIMLPSLITLLFVCLVAYYHYYYHENHVILPRVVMGLHIFALLSIVIMSSDYLFRNFLPATMVVAMFDMCVAPTIIATLLVTLAWQDALTDRELTVKAFLSSKMRIAFYCLVAFMATVAVMSVMARIFVQEVIIDYAYGMISILVVIMMLVFKFKTAYGIGSQLGGFDKTKNRSSREYMRRLMWRMILVGTAYFLYIIGMIVIISGGVSTPAGFFATGTLMYTSASLVAVAQVHTFFVKSREIKSSASSSGSKKTSSFSKRTTSEIRNVTTRHTIKDRVITMTEALPAPDQGEVITKRSIALKAEPEHHGDHEELSTSSGRTEGSISSAKVSNAGNGSGVVSDASSPPARASLHTSRSSSRKSNKKNVEYELSSQNSEIDDDGDNDDSEHLDEHIL